MKNIVLFMFLLFEVENFATIIKKDKTCLER